jgi:hypothetical protein
MLYLSFWYIAEHYSFMPNVVCCLVVYIKILFFSLKFLSSLPIPIQTFPVSTVSIAIQYMQSDIYTEAKYKVPDWGIKSTLA